MDEMIELIKEEDALHNLLHAAEVIEKHGMKPELLALLDEDKQLSLLLQTDLSEMAKNEQSGPLIACKIREKIGQFEGLTFVDENVSTEGIGTSVVTSLYKGVKKFVKWATKWDQDATWLVNQMNEELTGRFANINKLNRGKFAELDVKLIPHTQSEKLRSGLDDLGQYLNHLVNTNFSEFDKNRMLEAFHKLGRDYDENAMFITISDSDWKFVEGRTKDLGWTLENFIDMYQSACNAVQACLNISDAMKHADKIISHQLNSSKATMSHADYRQSKEDWSSHRKMIVKIYHFYFSFSEKIARRMYSIGRKIKDL